MNHGGNGHFNGEDAARPLESPSARLLDPIEGPLIESDEVQPGQVIRGFRIIERLQAGGFGEVFKAEQVQLKRIVAFKVLKLGMESGEIISRFETEQKALALMDHPNIAKIIDGALTPRGRMFFAMEYVPGVSVTDYCDSRRLSVPERLELFLQIYDAIEHAHERGVVHRDIKPSNVLVAERENKPFAKIIDFGIAKAVHGQLSDQGVQTLSNHFLGTPVYMSPEQAERSGVEIDRRSDIYSLGVLLYELLCGAIPIGSKEEAQGDLEAIRKLVLEKDPERPSTRIVQYNQEKATVVARCRDCEIDSLVNVLSKDLDRIVLRCLEKNRNRRYSTVSELKGDIQAYLSNEPSSVAPVKPERRTDGGSGDRLKNTALAALALSLVGMLAYQWLPITDEQRFVRHFKVLYPPPAGQAVKIGQDFNVRWVPAGRFTMGNLTNLSSNELPHEVVFHRGFFICETECTQFQWELVMGTRPSYFKGADLPVEQVNWEQAVEFCRKLTEKHREQGKVPKGWEWRLPTESEWEYAARAGTTGARHGELDLIAWHPKNSGFTTHPVGKKQANAWGLHDMIGNVWEWCSDWYIDSYPTGIVVHPKGPSEGKARVFRGGTYRSDNNYKLESAHRSGIAPEVRAQDIGFRLVLDQVSRPQ